MPKLILTVDDKVIDEYTIDKDTITIGRRTDNDICLDNLASVAITHKSQLYSMIHF